MQPLMHMTSWPVCFMQYEAATHGEQGISQICIAHLPCNVHHMIMQCCCSGTFNTLCVLSINLRNIHQQSVSMKFTVSTRHIQQWPCLQVEASQSMIRVVGLSATLPNYKDVATFLGVNHDTGLFYFDASYRPVPLEMQFVGVTEKNLFAQKGIMDEVCYEKVSSC